MMTSVYPADEWSLLIRLPGRVMVAAVDSGSGPPERAVAQGVAGLAGIAAGRAFDSDLVRAVVTAIYAEVDPASIPGPGTASQVDSGQARHVGTGGAGHLGTGTAGHAGPGTAGRIRYAGDAGLPDRIASRPLDRYLGAGRYGSGPLLPPPLRTDCRTVVTLLARRADPADSAAYRQWVQSVAAQVRRAAGDWRDGATGDGHRFRAGAGHRFLSDLGAVLGLP